MDTKGFLQSTTMWGAILNFATMIAQVMGWAHLQQIFSNPQLLDVVVGLAGSAGVLMTIIGRKNATEPVSLIKPVVRK